MKTFESGMTVTELKEMVKDWPEEDAYGEPTEVWMETGRGLSSPVRVAGQLNYRKDATGKEWSDLILKTEI